MPERPIGNRGNPADSEQRPPHPLAPSESYGSGLKSSTQPTPSALIHCMCKRGATLTQGNPPTPLTSRWVWGAACLVETDVHSAKSTKGGVVFNPPGPRGPSQGPAALGEWGIVFETAGLAAARWAETYLPMHDFRGPRFPWLTQGWEEHWCRKGAHHNKRTPPRGVL